MGLPKAEEEGPGRKPGRWGIDPARRRESNADFAAALLAFAEEKAVESVGVPGLGLKGLVDGVGRDDLGRSELTDMSPAGVDAGENRDGSVPARARRVEVWVADAVSGIAWLKSGKLSPLGDSGMVSRRGVELPLVGGPHICGVSPSCAWISRALSSDVSQLEKGCLFQSATNRLEYNLPPRSCEGDPAPRRMPAAALPRELDVFAAGIGKRTEPLEGGSMGEVVPVDEPERGGCEPSWGR